MSMLMTLFFMHYTLLSFWVLLSMLSLFFCMASGARSKWYHSLGILVSFDEQPTWENSRGFTCLCPR